MRLGLVKYVDLDEFAKSVADANPMLFSFEALETLYDYYWDLSEQHNEVVAFENINMSDEWIEYKDLLDVYNDLRLSIHLEDLAEDYADIYYDKYTGKLGRENYVRALVVAIEDRGKGKSKLAGDLTGFRKVVEEEIERELNSDTMFIDLHGRSAGILVKVY